MRIAIVAHSNVAERQRLFWRELSKHADVLVISPERWINGLTTFSVKEGQYEVFATKIYFPDKITNPINEFWFGPETFLKLQEFKPDIIYNQQETYSLQSIISQQWANQLMAKYVTFCF